MVPFLQSIVVILLLTLVTTATGWAVGVLSGQRLLQGVCLESRLSRIFVGTSIWILVFGWCSYLGLSAREARLPLSLGWLILLAAALAVRRPTLRWCHRPTAPTLVYLAACGLVVWFGLSLLLRSECAAPSIDSLTYASISRLLQDGGFGLAPHEYDRFQPYANSLWVYQTAKLRMGSTFLHALVQAYSGLDALLVHPALMAWGLLLNLGGIFLLGRWSLRVSRMASAAAVLVGAAAFNPLHVAAYQGFQPQLFGTAYFSFTLALLSRATQPAMWTRRYALLLALAAVSFVSVYSDLSPVLALVAGGFFVLTSLRAWRADMVGRFVSFSGWTLLGLAVLGNIEWWRAWHAVFFQLGSVVGCHLPWNSRQFFLFALGVAPFQLEEMIVHRKLLLVGGLVAALTLLGLLQVFRDRRATVVGLGLAVYVGLAMFFWFWAVNPFTGEIGHTWSVYKISKWVYPLVLVLQFAGLAWLVRRLSRPGLVLLLPGALALLVSASHHAHIQRLEAASMLELTGSHTPLAEWNDLDHQLNLRGAKRIVLVQPGGKYYNLGAYVFRSRPLSLALYDIDPSWLNAGDPHDPWQPGTFVLLWGDLPLGGPVLEMLAGRTLVLDRTRPCIIDLTCAYGKVQADSDGSHSLVLNHLRTQMSIWAPRAGSVRLRALLAPEPGSHGTPSHLSFTVVGAPTESLLVPVSEKLTADLPLRQGINVIALQCAGPSGAESLNEPLIRLHGPEVYYSDQTPSREHRRTTPVMLQEDP